MTRLGVVGDIHARWTPDDIAALDDRGLDGLLFTGDLGDVLHRGVPPIARAIGRLRTPAVVVPGNHDGPSPLGVLREALGIPHPPGSTRRLLARTRALAAELAPVPLGGFSVHSFGPTSVVVGRPWSMGGWGFGRAVRARHGITDLDHSAQRIGHLLRQAPGQHLVLLAHNGPAGRGHRPDAPWAVGSHGDIGDVDLERAIAQADSRLRVVAAGHVHHGRRRHWHVEHEGVHYLNAARVRRGWFVEVRLGTTTEVRAIGA